MTNPREALAAMGDGNIIRVKTASGIEYDVERDVIEFAADESEYSFGYVYGYRTTYGRGINGRLLQGEVRWFHLKNVTII